jgi:hypothetical protein
MCLSSPSGVIDFQAFAGTGPDFSRAASSSRQNCRYRLGSVLGFCERTLCLNRSCIWSALTRCSGVSN